MDDRRKNYRPWDAEPGSQERSRRARAAKDDLGVLPPRSIRSSTSLPSTTITPANSAAKPPFDVTMNVNALVYAYSGVSAPAEDAAACERNLAFRALVGTIRPTSAISDVRKIHLAAFRPSSSRCCGWRARWAWVKLGNLSTDGTKMGANASRQQGDELRVHGQGRCETAQRGDEQLLSSRAARDRAESLPTSARNARFVRRPPAIFRWSRHPRSRRKTRSVTIMVHIERRWPRRFAGVNGSWKGSEGSSCGMRIEGGEHEGLSWAAPRARDRALAALLGVHGR